MHHNPIQVINIWHLLFSWQRVIDVVADENPEVETFKEVDLLSNLSTLIIEADEVDD